MIWGKDSQYDTGKRDVLFHLGYSAKGRKEITITCKGMGEYDFSDIYVLLQPMEHYAEYYQQLKSDAPDHVKIQGNQITAKVQASKEEVLLCCRTVSSWLECKSEWKENRDHAGKQDVYGTPDSKGK